MRSYWFSIGSLAGARPDARSDVWYEDSALHYAAGRSINASAHDFVFAIGFSALSFAGHNAGRVSDS